MAKNGAINLDLELDDEEDEEDLLDEEVEEDEVDEEVKPKKKSILDITNDQIVSARKKLKSGELLFPEEEEELKGMTKSRGKRRSGPVPEVSQDILDQVGDALGEFDAETANKKQIRNVRKALQALSLARYPKKKKTKKSKA